MARPLGAISRRRRAQVIIPEATPLCHARTVPSCLKFISGNGRVSNRVGRPSNDSQTPVPSPILPKGTIQLIQPTKTAVPDFSSDRTAVHQLGACGFLLAFSYDMDLYCFYS